MMHPTSKPTCVSRRVKDLPTGGIELLESRIAPAGVVSATLIDGVLTITGDPEDNRVEVSTVIGNQVLVAGLSGTLLNGGMSHVLLDVPAKGISSIVAELGGGNDNFTLRDMVVKGDVTVSDSGGGISMGMRELNARNFTFTGSDDTDSLSSQGLALKGNFSTNPGGGVNFTSLSGVNKILGSLSYTGAGSDAINVYDMDVKRGVDFEFNGSAGAPTFYGYSNIQGGMQVTSTANLDLKLTLDVAKITGDVVVGLGTGDNTVQFYGSTFLDLRGRVQVTGGGGDDLLSFSGYRVNVAKGVTFDAGGGENGLGQAAAIFTTTALRMNGGAGIDFVELAGSLDTTVKGLATFNLGDGDNSISAPDLNGTVSLGAFAYTGGTGYDQLLVSKSWLVRGASQIDLASGGNKVQFLGRSVTFGGRLELHSTNMGVEGSTIQFDAGFFTASKGVLITQVGDADQTLYLNGGYSVVLKGGLTYQGGTGADNVSFNLMRGSTSGLFSVDAGDGNNDVEFEVYSARVSAPINVKTGSGNDSIRFQADAATFAAPITVSAGAGNNETEFGIEYGRANYLKAVKIVSESMGTDSLELRNAHFLGGLDVKMGGGVSTVDIDDVTLRGKVVIDTAEGNDTLLIEQDGTGAASLLAGVVDLKLGDGDDTVLIGDGTLVNRILLMARLTVDGGAGSDTSNDIAGFAQNFPSGSVNLAGIP